MASRRLLDIRRRGSLWPYVRHGHVPLKFTGMGQARPARGRAGAGLLSNGPFKFERAGGAGTLKGTNLGASGRWQRQL